MIPPVPRVLRCLILYTCRSFVDVDDDYTYDLAHQSDQIKQFIRHN
jgi:hypothetical protein